MFFYEKLAKGIERSTAGDIYTPSVKELDRFLESFKETEIGLQLEAVSTYYDSIKDDFTPFCNEFNVHCPSGCGGCCRHFVPDLTPSEALIIAVYALTAMKEKDIDKLLIENKDNTLGPCPFFDPDSSFHCTIYPVRSLTCRLFGSCTSMTRSGRAFRRCCFTDDSSTMPEKLNESDLEKAKCSVPVMGRYGEELLSLYANTGETALLPEAVQRQMERIRLLLMLTGKSPSSFQ